MIFGSEKPWDSVGAINFPKAAPRGMKADRDASVCGPLFGARQAVKSRAPSIARANKVANRVFGKLYPLVVPTAKPELMG